MSNIACCFCLLITLHVAYAPFVTNMQPQCRNQFTAHRYVIRSCHQLLIPSQLGLLLVFVRYYASSRVASTIFRQHNPLLVP